MGLKISLPTSNLFQSCSFFSSLKNCSPRQASFDQDASQRPGIFSPLPKPPDLTSLISSCISAASATTREYLTFKDPENKFHPSPQVLTQVFLMTYITKSINFNITDIFNCTVMTPEQGVLLGADWVWAMLEKSTQTPKIQIAVQVLLLAEREEASGTTMTAETRSESIQIDQLETSHKSKCERMVEFCTSIGSDCYALFLFFGIKDDKENIYGVLSNNFGAAIKKCSTIDRAMIEDFFRGSPYFHTPLGMTQALLSQKMGEPLTLLIKFS